MESGQRALTNVIVLRRSATELGIPLGLFGLAGTGVVATRLTGTADKVPTGHRRGRLQEGGDDPVRRRELLSGLADLAIAPVSPQAPPTPPQPLIKPVTWLPASSGSFCTALARRSRSARPSYVPD
jgi:hypothetical protein